MKYWLFLILSILLLSNLNAENKKLSEEQLNELIESNFETNGKPLRYFSNILIQIQGIATKDDSIIFQELIDTLNIITAKWDIYLIPSGTSNLIFEIGNPVKQSANKPFHDVYVNYSQIVDSKIYIRELKPETSFKERKKIIRYYLLRSLVKFRFDADLTVKTPGSVFSVSEASKCTFTPIDFQIIERIYSQKYERSRANRNKETSTLKAAKRRRVIQLLGSLISSLIPITFLVLMFYFGYFKKHQYKFIPYLKQGFIIILAGVIFLISTFASMILNYSKYSQTNGLQLLIAAISIPTVFGLLTIASLYFVEKPILKGNSSLLWNVLFPFFTTTIIPSAIVSIAFQFISKTSDTGHPLSHINILLSCLYLLFIIAAMRTIFIYLSRKSESIIHQKDVELARISELHKQAELQSLRSKINPHFLYNSLNSIASLALIDAKRTEQMALSLSDFFRYSINREQKQTNPISEELEAIKTYLEIEKVRFGKRLNFKITCPENLLHQQIPQLLIQPLVENAIKHGISKSIENGTIKITVSEKNRKLHIRVADNGPNFPDGPLSGFGIRNTNERLHLLYGKKASINWENGAEKYIEITFPA